jgi:hypothetical protein
MRSSDSYSNFYASWPEHQNPMWECFQLPFEQPPQRKFAKRKIKSSHPKGENDKENEICKRKDKVQL